MPFGYFVLLLAFTLGLLATTTGLFFAAKASDTGEYGGFVVSLLLAGLGVAVMFLSIKYVVDLKTFIGLLVRASVP